MTNKRIEGRVQVIALTLFVVILGFLVVGFTSCATKKVIKENTDNTTIHNSSVEHTYERGDSLIGIPRDTATMRMLMACDSLGNVYIKDIELLEGERARLNAHLDDVLRQLHNRTTGDLQLDVDCECDSLAILVEKLREKTVYMEATIDSLSHRETNVEYVPVPPKDYNYKTNCTKGFWWLLGIDLLILVGIILFFVGKKTPWGKVVFTAFKVFFGAK